MTAFLLLTLLGQPAEPLRFQETKDKERQVIAHLPAAMASKLPLGRLTQDQGEAILTVSLLSDETKKPGPTMLGKYDRAANELTFTPRFPFLADTAYRATVLIDGKPITLDYRAPALKNQTPPRIVKILPTTNVLPANHLRFYIYFDRPMRGGKELFNLIQLVDDKGNVIDAPWLTDEIWDEENNCLILYIHPGRIKWGVELRQELGPVLFEKREYSFVVKAALSDLNGNKLGKDHVKYFRTTPEDRVRNDVSKWILTPPPARTKEPLLLTFPKSLDHRSLQRFLVVSDEKGKRLDGTMTLGKDEKLWSFTPARPWQTLGYHLDVDPRLEDVAGNTPALPFDVDLTAPKLPPQKLRFDFQAK